MLSFSLVDHRVCNLFSKPPLVPRTPDPPTAPDLVVPSCPVERFGLSPPLQSIFAGLRLRAGGQTDHLGSCCSLALVLEEACGLSHENTAFKPASNSDGCGVGAERASE